MSRATAFWWHATSTGGKSTGSSIDVKKMCGWKESFRQAVARIFVARELIRFFGKRRPSIMTSLLGSVGLLSSSVSFHDTSPNAFFAVYIGRRNNLCQHSVGTWSWRTSATTYGTRALHASKIETQTHLAKSRFLRLSTVYCSKMVSSSEPNLQHHDFLDSRCRRYSL